MLDPLDGVVLVQVKTYAMGVLTAAAARRRRLTTSRNFREVPNVFHS